MVQQHVRGAQALAAGAIAALPDTRSGAAYTQAAWRFLNNERVGLSELAKPLLSAVPGLLNAHCERYGLVMHDWSRLNFAKHTRKADRLKMTHKTDVGYELQSSVLVSDASGKPLAPVVHWRTWSAQGSRFLVRAKDAPKVCFEGVPVKPKELAERLSYQSAGEVLYHGRTAHQTIAQAKVLITRKAKPARSVEGKRVAPVASCACVLVWQLAAATSPQALDIQRFLVRLSGRQTKRRRPVTAPALLAGLWMLFSTLTLLEHYDLDQLKQYAQFIFPNRYGNHKDV